MEFFKDLCNVEHEYLSLWNVDKLPVEKDWLEKNKIEIKQWNIHDYENLIAFKDYESWINFTYALSDLILFYHRMERNHDEFQIFFRSYSKDSLTELGKDCSCFIRENYWDDILTFADNGYVFMYFTTQRECHDNNQFLMYMVDNWMYNRVMKGHKVSKEDEIEDIQFICINEK